MSSQRGQLSNPEALGRYLLAGRAVITLRSKTTGEHRTLRIGRKRERVDQPQLGADDPLFFRAVYAPEDAREDKYLGCVTGRGWFTTKNAATAANAAEYVRVAKWVGQHVAAGQLDKVLEQAEVWHEGVCGRCGRRLTVPESIETGFGPECNARRQA